MEQKLITKPEEDITSKLVQALIKRSFIKGDVIKELIRKRDLFVNRAQKEIQGTCYIIDYHEKKLNIFDTYSGDVLHSIPLPGQLSEYNPADFDSWGTDAAIINTKELQKQGEITYDKKDNYGIVIGNGKSYLYNPDINEQKLLGLTKHYIFGAIPKKSKSGLPFDMYFSEDCSLLCLSNRDEGKVYLFDVKSVSFTDEINVRGQGHNKTINLAISTVNKKIYITDNLSPFLSIYDISEKTLTKKNINSGILGNLCLAPDEKSLYVITIKPEQNLKNIDINNFSEIKAFPPKGELFSIGDAPCDLITVSPDKKNIFTMTFINDPNPFTPVISVIDIKKNKPVKRFSIKDESKPINLCFQDVNPVGEVNKSIEDMIVENKLFSVNKLRDLKNAIINGEEDLFENEDEEGFVEIEGEKLEFELRQDSTSGSYEGITPKKKNNISLPVKANKHIKECLANNFWMKHEIDLLEIPEIQENLNKVADQVRRKLQDYDLEIVEVKAFYNEKIALEGVILREFILEMLDEEESENRKQIKTVPTNCPNCRALLLGSWDCPTCGFEIEKPEDAIKRKIASVDPLSNLAKGNIMLLDSKNGEIVEVDSFKVPVWKMSKEQLGLKSINSAIRLENGNTLILDGETSEFVEATPKGKIVRKFKVGEDGLPLNNPAFFTMVDYDHLLIADTYNHRVLETDHEGNILWEYGTYGMSGIRGSLLNSPRYIQKTYDGTYLITDTGNDRIIELNRFLDTDKNSKRIKIEWEYGNEISIAEGEQYSSSHLNNPLMAIKDLLGNIIILDAGNKRVIEITYDKKINWQYDTETGDEITSISYPERFTRLKNKDILLIGDGKYVQFMPTAGNRIVWHLSQEDLVLKTKAGFGVLQENITKVKVKYGAVPQIRIRAPKYILRTQQELKAELEAIVAQRMSEATIAPPLWVDSETPLSFFTPGKTVSPMPVLLVDKTNNKVMLADREANLFWSYGDNKVQKLIRVKTAFVTPERNVLITNAKSVMEISHEKLRIYYMHAEHELKMSRSDVLISDVSEKIWEYPCNAQCAVRLNNGNTLISESKNFRIIEINKAEKIIWEHQHNVRHALASYMSRLPNGNTLITYSSTHEIVEVTPNHEIVWSFGESRVAHNDNKHVSFPEYACRLENGNTLIADSKNGRILEVSYSGDVVWDYEGTDLIRLISPTYVQRLKDGNTYIVHGGNREIIEVDRKGDLVWKLVLPLKK